MIDDAFAQTLKKLRVQKGLSQEELGLRADLHRTYISQLERGLKSPSLRTLHKISVVLDIPLSELMHETEHELANVPTK